MLFLLSPAKKLDYDSPVRTTLHTQPQFIPQAQALISVLREQTPEQVQKLMKLSDALTTLNVQRYADWSPEFSLDNARQAILAFDGDVYEGLQAKTLSDAQLQWAQQHVLVLSGLYGVLRPLDLMQPYRLEMGTRLATPQGKNLYEYWGSQLATYIDQHFAQQADPNPVVVNLASNEYFKAVDTKSLRASVVECVFQDQKGEDWKIISFYAKKARGLMVRYAIDNQVQHVEELQGFNSDGYRYTPEVSTATKLVFRRPESV
ncbi:MAG: peroxide stress protein YaaA [Alcaligenaceae bacterium]|uniref:UPF0246 protein GCM10023337_08380 n=1 Tax=Paenalcaligenes hermetiae TaxID=1157987 RepID=A0ABP9LZ01_9BURK|nr:peroxide stress protein YaaA [Paenalcaligenes sp.]NLJ62675.1 peroxide stress protein YaaA [Alcaligenaceae bacterium]